MTNGPGKSDSPVVPAKSPNKAGQPAAEGMEGRGGDFVGVPEHPARIPTPNSVSMATDNLSFFMCLSPVRRLNRRGCSEWKSHTKVD